VHPLFLAGKLNTSCNRRVALCFSANRFDFGCPYPFSQLTVVATQCWTTCGLLASVREVIVVEEVGYPVYERLSLGERVREGSENSWKESYSCHRDQRLLVQPIAEAQGKGG
jgi:hypothetical protein